MHTDGPVRRLTIGAVPGKATGLRALVILLLGAGIMCAAALAVPAAETKAVASQSKAAAPGDYVGGEVCATCHDEVAKGFAGNPHTRMAAEHGTTGVNCEGCHGSGKAHVDGGGDKTKIFNPANASTKEIDQKCLGCHQGKHSNFERGAHAEGNVSCLGWHDIHGSKQDALLKAPQPTLCFQCHTEIKPQFSMPFHHKVEEGLIQCSDCHDPHGTTLATNLKATADMNAVCTKCHTDVRGPFVFEHAPVKAEGCVSCHTPHGSQNPRLLNMPSIATLCNQCHSPLSAGTVHGMDAGSTTVAPCIDCHTMIHGSNISQAFIK